MRPRPGNEALAGRLPVAAPIRRARRARARRRWTAIALFLAPALVLYGLLVIAPIVQAVYYSGYRWNGLGQPETFVGLENFTRALSDDVFLGALKHNAIFVVLSLCLQLPFALGVALMLNARLHGRALLRVLYFAPFVLSEVVTGVDLHADAAARRAGRRRLAGRPRVAGGPEHRRLHAVRGHLVEVLRLPHDPLPRRPAADPARARGGGADRRRQPPAGPPPRDAAAAGPDDPDLRRSCRSSARCSSSTSCG